MQVTTDVKLFEAYLRPVLKTAYGTAIYLTAEAEQAEALVERAVLRAFRSFGGHSSTTNFKVWFLSLLCDQFQSETRTEEPLSSLAEWERIADLFFAERKQRPDGPDFGVSDTGKRLPRLATEQIASVFAKMPGEYRTLCALYFLEEWSYQEIADIVGCSRDLARTRLHRGRQWLHYQLQEVSVREERSRIRQGERPAVAPVS